MSNFNKILLGAVLTLGLVAGLVGYHDASSSLPVAHAQGTPNDQTFGFSGSLTQPTTGTIISATTLSSVTQGPAVIAPPGVTAPSARIHLKRVDVTVGTACTVQVQEHPVTGPNIYICNIGANANVQQSAKSGFGESLGLQGYITAPGSSIVLVTSSNSAITVTTNCTASLE